MSIIRKIILGFLFLFFGFLVFMYFYVTIPNVRDGEKLGRIKFPKNENVFNFPQNIQPLPVLNTWLKPKSLEKYTDGDKFLADHNVIGFLVLHKDTIVYENYFNGFKKVILHRFFGHQSFSYAVVRLVNR
ncbi:MAG: hypothetical protein IPP53_17095 [Bacteroidetes bacterium]|nr:hypothetical protein [Bacteroidota bacterium]